MDTSSELIVIPGDSKYHCGPPLTLRVYTGQVINGASAQVHNILGPVCPPTDLVVIFPVLECINGIGILSNWQNPQISS